MPGADNVILNIAHGPFGLAGAGESAEIAAASALGEDPGEFATFCVAAEMIAVRAGLENGLRRHLG